MEQLRLRAVAATVGPRTLLATALMTAPAVPAGAAAVASEEPPLVVSVREDPASDSWEVTYRLPAPAPGLLFQRGREPFRAGAWKVLSDGVSWEVREGRDALVAAAPVSEIAVQFPSDFAPRVKEYELNLSFTDGGRLLYTGHLSVRPLSGDGAGEIPDHLWRLATTADRWVAVLGREARGRLDWRELAAATGDGTYVYFGAAAPERGERMSFVLDPGLPDWLRVRAELVLPGLIDRFTATTGIELSFRPLVLVSHRPEEISGLTFSGGTLDGLVQMAAIGRNWESESSEAAEMWLDRIAHEIFHFWAGETFTTPLEGGDAWLKEGAADLFALRALEGLGTIDVAAMRRRLVENANACLVGLAGEPLLASASAGRFSNLYRCGSTLWHWAGTAVARASGGEDGVGELVRALFAAAATGELTSYRFLETLHRLTGDHRAGAPLARLLFEGVPEEADRFFLERARAAGLPVALVPPAEATLRAGTTPAADDSWSRLLALRDEGQTFQ